MGLNVRLRPRLNETLVDKIDVSVSGSFGPETDMHSAGQLFETYRMMLVQRVQQSGNHWRAPKGQSLAKFTARLRSDHLTVSDATIKVEWAQTTVNLSVRLTLNPTRTLIHNLPSIAEAGCAEQLLRAMSPSQFFACNTSATPATTLDGNDNALDRPDLVRTYFGDGDFASAYMPIYEEQLRRWIMDAVAPLAFGFNQSPTTHGIQAISGPHTVRLNWAYLTIWSAEAYLERRHSNAVELMDRLAHAIPASEIEASWRQYGENELGGRRQGSPVVGYDHTKTIQQIAYAKTRQRLRLETRFNSGVRNAVRLSIEDTSAHSPLTELLNAARRRSVSLLENRWGAFCRLCEEPPRATMGDVADFMVRVADLAREEGVYAQDVLASLLGSGGIDETDEFGTAPPTLIARLIQSRIIDRRSLQNRRRPGAGRRYRLAHDWADVAERLQRALSETDPND
jgi:hypothetical protein